MTDRLSEIDFNSLLEFGLMNASELNQSLDEKKGGNEKESEGVIIIAWDLRHVLTAMTATVLLIYDYVVLIISP